MPRDIIKEFHEMQAINPNCGAVYNGNTAVEWYTLYCQAILRCKRLEDQIEEKAKEKDYGSNAGIKCDMDSGPCACGAWH